MGRPRKAISELRSEMLGIRVDDFTRKAIEQIAKDEDVTITHVVRRALREIAKKPKRAA